MRYLVKFFWVRFRVNLHYFLYMHLSSFNFAGPKALVFYVHCKYCDKVFLDERDNLKVIELEQDKNNAPKATQTRSQA